MIQSDNGLTIHMDSNDRAKEVAQVMTRLMKDDLVARKLIKE
ncbi:hypothetical protein ME783_07400 [Lactobacillus delbrueckii]|nr:hypothetical protein ME783_07400 [Lactobacillus delbrueckii]